MEHFYDANELFYNAILLFATGLAAYRFQEKHLDRMHRIDRRNQRAATETRLFSLLHLVHPVNPVSFFREFKL